MTPNQLRRREDGFTLVELTISLIVVTEVLLAVLVLFDFSGKIARAQSNISEMQQSLRLAQAEMNPLVRAAGRGGLDFFTTAPGGAVWVRNNVGVNATIGAAGTPGVVEGTDVITLRGVFSTPMFQIRTQGAIKSLEYRTSGGAVTTDVTQAFTGFLRVYKYIDPITGAVVPTPEPAYQDLQAISNAKAQGIHEALVLEDSVNSSVHAVVELLPDTTVFTSDVARPADPYWLVNFRIKSLSASDLANSYITLTPLGNFPPSPWGTPAAGPFPSTMTNVAIMGILEEWRYYVRKNYAIAGNAASEPMPKLTKARFMPGTDTAYGQPPGPGVDNSGNLAVDVADNILDMQAALALDTTNGGGTIAADTVNGTINETLDGRDDDWLFNSSNDNITNAVWISSAPNYARSPYWLRVSFLARTDRRDPQYEAPIISRIEDRTYLATDPINRPNDGSGTGGTQRLYRRRILQAVLQMRNVL